MTDDPLAKAQTVLRHLLDGNPPNGITPADCGPFADVVSELYQAHATGGIEAARRVFDALSRRNPELLRLASGPDLQPEWLDTHTIVGWRLFTLVDAYQERPPLKWVISDLLSLPSLNIVYGAPGTLKSMLLADALVCVAGGLSWLKPLPGQSIKPFQTISVPTLWADFDNGKRRTHERFEALARARNLPADLGTLFYTSMPNPWLDASDNLAIDDLINLISVKGIKLVVLDNLGTITGGVDENSPAMIPVMSNLRQLAESTGAAIVVIHHQRKGNGYKGRAGDTLRGHSCIEAAIDLALLIERKEDSDRASVRSTKSRDVDVSPFSVEWTYEHKPDSTELATARFFGAVNEIDEKTETIQFTIINCVKAAPGLSQTKLRDTVKAKVPDASNHAIRNEILGMVEQGRIKVADATNGNAQAYYPNPDYVDF